MRRIKSIKGLNGESSDEDYEVIIEFEDGGYIRQYHEQDCCESVYVNQVDGDPAKHIGATILEITEKVLDRDQVGSEDLPEYVDSLTATFYTMKTSKGYLDWRWYGESNGYYSESVDCELINQGASDGKDN